MLTMLSTILMYVDYLFYSVFCFFMIKYLQGITPTKYVCIYYLVIYYSDICNIFSNFEISSPRCLTLIYISQISNLFDFQFFFKF